MPTRDNILVPAKLSSEKRASLKKILKDRILELKFGMRELYENKIVKWNKAYEAVPREEQRQFPFQNASNLVIPIIAIHTDTLKAQIIQAIFRTDPRWTTLLLGEHGPEGDTMREAYEEFMNYMAGEPQELDLYRVYGEGIPETIKYGTTTYKCNWEEKTRDFLVPGGDGSGEAKDFLTRTVYSGPRPEKLPFNGFYLPPTAKTIEEADFKAHKRTMRRWEIDERGFTGLWDSKDGDKDVIESILASPDRTNVDIVEREKEETLGAKTDPSFGYREWDVWECYYNWNVDGSVVARVIVTYHPLSDTLARVVWDNFEMEWFVGSRMAHRDDMYHGYGFAETIWPFEEGASETFNGYRDNQTVANTRVWRVSPDSKLHQGYRIYPSAMLPAEKDEIEALAHGDVSTINLDELRMLLDLAERRSGVSPPQQGFGAGMQSGKRGIYGAMATFSVLQEGNSRKDLNVSDMRDAHVRLGRLVTRLYGDFGKGDKFHQARLELFGKKAPLIEQAIQNIIDRKMALPCYSSTASINKEVEKQNDLMLSQVTARHYQMIAQLLGAVQNVMTPPVVKEYFVQVILASNLLMRGIMRNFNHNEVERLIPDPIKMMQQQAQQQSQLAGPGGQNVQQPQTQSGGQPPPTAAPQATGPRLIGPKVVGGSGGTPVQ